MNTSNNNKPSFERRKKKAGISFSTIVIATVLSLIALCCVLPFVLTVSVSVTDSTVIGDGYRLIPKAFSFDAYRILFASPQKIINAYGVSIFVTAVGFMLNLVITLLTAYPLSINGFRYNRIVSFLVFFTMMFSGGLIAYYILTVKYLNLKDSIWVLILPNLLIPSNVFLLRIFLQDVPSALYESARIDGSGEYGILFRIVTPIAMPGIATIALFIVLMYWNDYITGMLFLENEALYPIQLLLYRYGNYLETLKETGMAGGAMAADESILFAMCVLVTAPMLFVFMFFQKYFVNGLSAGAVKE